MLTSQGGVTAYGDAPALGNATLPHRAVALAMTNDRQGYWVFDSNGCSQNFGTAPPIPPSESLCGKALNGPIIDAATNPNGPGYWLVASDGGVSRVRRSALQADRWAVSD